MSFEYYRLQHPDFIAEYGELSTLMEVDSLDLDQRYIVFAFPVTETSLTEVKKTVMMVRNFRDMSVGLRQWSG